MTPIRMVRAHAEAVMAACLAAAEQQMNPETMAQGWRSLAVFPDTACRKCRNRQASCWSLINELGSYRLSVWIAVMAAKEVATVVPDYPKDLALLDNNQRQVIDSVIDGGLFFFYQPVPSEFTIPDATEAQKERLKRAPHNWSFEHLWT